MNKKWCLHNNVLYKEFIKHCDEFKRSKAIILDARYASDRIINMAKKRAVCIKKSAEDESAKNIQRSKAIILDARYVSDRIINMAKKRAVCIRKSAEDERAKNIHGYAKKIEEACQNFIDSINTLRTTLSDFSQNISSEIDLSKDKDKKHNPVLDVYQACLMEIRDLRDMVIEKDAKILIYFYKEMKVFHGELMRESPPEILNEYYEYLCDEYMKVLEKMDISEFNPEIGEKFDPRRHKTKDGSSGYEYKVVAKAHEPGYQSSKRILEHAIVDVVNIENASIGNETLTLEKEMD